MWTNQHFPVKLTPTAYPAETFSALEDAATIRRARKVSKIIDILAYRSVSQRLEIIQTFKIAYNMELQWFLSMKLDSKLSDALVGLMIPLPVFYAKELHDALSGTFTTDHEAIIEILASLSNHGINEVVRSYENVYHKPLEDDLLKGIKGHFRRLCVALVQCNRDESQTVDETAAISDARALYKAGATKLGTDESIFTWILVTRSYDQLHQIFYEYTQITGIDIEVAITNEFGGNIRNGYLAIVKCCRSKFDFFAERLTGKSDKTMIRIIVSRSEIDLGNIKEAFATKYEKSLESWIKNFDTSKDCKRALLALVGA